MDAFTKRPTEFEDKLRSAHEKLRKDHVDLLYKVQQVEKENEELQLLIARHANGDQQIKELQERVLSLESSISPLEIRNGQLEDEVLKLQNEKITLDMNIKQINNKSQQKQERYETLMEEKGCEITELTDELSRMKESVQLVTLELNSIKNSQDINETPKQLAKKILIPDLSIPPPHLQDDVQKIGAIPKVFIS